MSKSPSPTPKAAKPATSTKAAKVLVNPPLEAQLESRLDQALSVAFPRLDRSKIRVQTVLKFRLGRTSESFDAAKAWTAEGRADLLIFHDGRPLVVIEVKRSTLKLTSVDAQQAQSYANQFSPRPPVMIVTNGHETHLYNSATGQPWAPETDGEKAVAKLLENAAKVAEADMKWAIDVLIGPGADVWPTVVRARTRDLIARRTAQAGQGGKPYADRLLIPREATQSILTHLRAGETVVLVDGPPLAGKSNVLRELAETTETSDEFAVLLMRGTTGLFQGIANILSPALEWEVTPQNVRQWLRRLPLFDRGPVLVLAIDGLEPDGPMARDLEELAEFALGDRVRVVAATDDTSRFTKGGNKRNSTAIGDLTPASVTVGMLSVAEFAAAERVLGDLAIHFLPGAAYAADYRAPWVLRALYDRLVVLPNYDPATGYFMIPGILGVAAVDEARRAFKDQSEVQRAYGLLARDDLDDVGGGPMGLALARSYSFVIRRDALSRESQSHLETLVADGWVSLYRNAEGDDLVVPTTPELFISEMALELSRRLETKVADDPVAAAYWLATELEGSCFADVVGAQAIRDLMTRTGGGDWRLIETLLAMEPELEVMTDGLVAMSLGDGPMINVRFEGNLAWLTDKTGTVRGPSLPVEEPQRVYGVMAPWMILSQLGALPMAMGDPDNRADAEILLQIGMAPIPLLRATKDAAGHLTHDLGDLGEVLCQDQGVIEPATASMAQLLGSRWVHVDDWISDAIKSGSVPLLHRVYLALLSVRVSVQRRSKWADTTLNTRVRPALDACLKSGLATLVPEQPAA